MKVKKANTIVRLIWKTFSYLDGPLFKHLFTVFVRPHVEYGQVMWTPHLKRYITILENVQCWETKLVDGFHHMSYSERLKKLNPPSLVYRRARGNITEIFIHFHSYNNCTLPKNFRPRNRPSRKHDYPLVWKAPTDGVRGLQAMFSPSKRSKPRMSSKKKSYMPSLSTHLKTNWMKPGKIFQ